MEKDAATVLEEAADLLLIHGRCQVHGHSQDGEFCVLGAIAEVVQPGWWKAPEAMHYWSVALRRKDVGWALQEHLHPDRAMLELADIAGWNDSTDDDFEVIDTLRHVAKGLRNEAGS
jgi:hypothetical protein